MICINCSEEINETNKIDSYPSEFSVYLCLHCGYENEWWILLGFDKEKALESIIRGLSFESYLNEKEIYYNQIIQYIKEKYNEDKFLDDAIQKGLNHLYKQVLEPKKIEAIRYPINKLHDEKYNKIIISDRNKFEDFFNKRIIRQWDLKYIQLINLEKFHENIINNKNIRYKNRWLAAIDYFLESPEF